MVVMAMSNKDTIDLSERLRQDLSAEIRTAVNEQSRALCLHQHRTAGTLVVRISAPTHLTLTSYHGHAARSSCT